MSENYELPFDEKEGKFKAQTITADVVRTGFDGECEIESADFEFPDDTLELETSFAAGETEVAVDVSLLDDVYKSGDFLSIIQKEFEVKFSLVPREYDASGQYSLAPMLSDSCTVKCGPVSLKGRLEEPTPEELPIPALGEESTELLLKVTMGLGGRPRPNLKLKWERVEGGCQQHGKLEPITDTTDEEGEIRLSYTAPKLYYRPQAKFFEEYRFLNETGGKEQEIFRLKIPLAPWLVFRLRAEKTTKIDDVDYGISSELGPVVEIDPRERLRVLQAEPKLKATVEGKERDFPVLQAEYLLLFGDENGVEEEQEGIRLKSTAEGKLHWEIPELKEAFGNLGKTYSLSDERSELPEIVLSEAAEKAVAFYESRLKHSPITGEVFSGDLGDRLKKYRFVHCEQLGKEEKQVFEKIRSSMELLGIGVRYVVPFNKAFSQQFEPLLGVIGDTVWDVFNIIWNVGNFAGKIFAALGKFGEKIASGIASRVKASPGFFNAVISKFKWVGWALEKLASGVSWLGGKISGFAGFIAKYVPKLQSFAQGLGAEIRELLSLWQNIRGKAMKSLAGLVIALKRFIMMVADALRTLFDCVANLMKDFAFWLISHVGVGLKMAQESYLNFLQKYVNIEFFEEAFKMISHALGNPETMQIPGQALFVQLGNLLQAKVEQMLGKGSWTGASADRAVSGFATMKAFDPAAKTAVDRLFLACKNLDVGVDPESKRRGTVAVASGMKDLQLRYEVDFINREAIRMFVGSMKVPVELAIGVIVFMLTAGTGTGLYLELCTGLEVALSSMSIWFVNVPHAVGIFIGAYAILHAYLSAVIGLGH